MPAAGHHYTALYCAVGRYSRPQDKQPASRKGCLAAHKISSHATKWNKRYWYGRFSVGFGGLFDTGARHPAGKTSRVDWMRPMRRVGRGTKTSCGPAKEEETEQRAVTRLRKNEACSEKTILAFYWDISFVSYVKREAMETCRTNQTWRYKNIRWTKTKNIIYIISSIEIVLRILIQYLNVFL